MAGNARETLLARVTEIAHRAASGAGVEVWDVEISGSGQNRILRVFIDKLEGVTHADCELISMNLGTLLDAEGAVPGGEYQLEVSSPGVERKLLRIEHFVRFTGQKVRLALREPVENQRRWEGTLAGVADDVITLDADPGKAIRVRMGQIEKANLKFEW